MNRMARRRKSVRREGDLGEGWGSRKLGRGQQKRVNRQTGIIGIGLELVSDIKMDCEK